MARSARRKPYQGRYRVENLSKYKGDATQVFFRSKLEYTFMKKIDRQPNVIEWSSEEIVIPYISPIDGLPHRYFPDNWVKVKSKDGTIKQMLVEIKPASQIVPPKKPKRKSKRYEEEVLTWVVNCAKWEAAEKYCREHNMVFKKFTEKEIYG